VFKESGMCIVVSRSRTEMKRESLEEMMVE
jgi:hypothetical protein